ncbi:diversity-generating retroelement protein Avd [Candidatus Collierbacteria bacterium]|nr:diversity-generating retroelement protein Avd [Candidatus Collierbacteria bacterium]
MEKFILHQKTYDFILYLYPIINRLPKNHRLILGRKLEELALDLLMSLMKANKAREEKRKRLQLETSDTLDYLRIVLRLAKDTRLISVKQYAHSAEKLNEIGRMLSSWMGSIRSV